MRILPTHPRTYAHRFPGRNWLVAWMILSLAFCPAFPGGNRAPLPFPGVALASGDGEYYDGAMDDPGYTDYPDDPYIMDSDDDGWSDGGEDDVGTDPHDSASYPGAPDPAEVDSDGDGLRDEQENNGFEIEFEVWVEDSIGYYDETSGTTGYWMPVTSTVYTDPQKVDTDGDLLPDGWEVATPGFDPTSASDGLADPDLDGLATGEEYVLGTAWQNPDSDWDGFLDGDEVLVMGTNPNDTEDPLPTVDEPAAESGGATDSGTSGGDGTGDGGSGTGDGGSGTSGGSSTGGTQGGGSGGQASGTGGGQGSGGVVVEFSLETRGAYFIYGDLIPEEPEDDPGADTCEILERVTEYVQSEDGSYDEVEMVICECEGTPHLESEHAHGSDGAGVVMEEEEGGLKPGHVVAQDGMNPRNHDDYGSTKGDYSRRYGGLDGNPTATDSVPGSLGSWLPFPPDGAGDTDEILVVSASKDEEEDSEGEKRMVASAEMAVARVKAVPAPVKDVVWSYLIVSRRRSADAEPADPWEVMGAETVSLRIRAGNEYSDEAAVLIPNIQTSFVNKVSLLPVDLAVDGNRDGELSFGEEDRVTEEKPYRFWINDDRDDSEDTENLSLSGAVDSENYTIDTKRDLEDFTRLAIKIGGFHERFSSGDWELGFKWTDAPSDPSAKIYLAADQDGSNDYLTDEAAATSQTSGQYKTALLTATKDTITYVGPGALANLSESDSTVHFLVEGDDIGKGRLTVVFKINGQEHEAAGVWFDLHYIDSFYERVKATPEEPSDIDDPFTFNGVEGLDLPSMSFVSDQGGISFKPDPDETKDYIVLVHGWNTSYDAHITKAETFYKRLWHAGYKGRFSAFRWPTTEGTFKFNEGDYRAWHSGKSLKQYIASLPSGYTRNIAAHSMGGTVLASAIREGLAANNCAFMQAATPAMCFDGSITDWDYTTPDTTSDTFTQNLGFKNKVPSSQNRLINFSLIGDPIAGGLWEANNIALKPQVGFSYDYDYIPTTVSGKKLRLGFLLEVGRYVTDVHEALSFVTKSHSKTLSISSSTGGVIDETISLNSFGFKDADVDNPHSAQFWEPIQNVHEFYKEIFTVLIK